MAGTKEGQPQRGWSESLRLLKRCAGYFRPYLWRMIIGASAMALAGLCDAAAAWLIKPAMDDIFVNQDRTALLLVPIAYFFIVLIKVSTRLLQNYSMQSSALKVLEALRDELYSKIILLPVRFYEGTQVGMLMSRIINDVVAIRLSMPAIIMMTRQVITIVSLICVVFYQDAVLAFWAVIVLPVAFLPFIYFSRRMRKLSRKSQSMLGDISSLLQEVLSGIRVVKAFGTERQEAARLDTENKRLLKNSLRQVLASECSSSAMELVGAVAVGLVIWFGGMQVIEGKSTPGTFFSFVAALIMLYEPVKKISLSNTNLQQALAGAERVFEILDNPDLRVEEGGDVVFDGDFQELTFEHVTFIYSDGTKALDDISFSVRKGERLALVGPSGAGKTSFVSLIPRFYDPQQGRVVLNGRPTQDYTLASLRHAVSLVSQDNFLFNLTVLENINYGMPGASEEDARKAAVSAFADDFIRQMPEGYNTVIGERGVKLSGGQRQRLTIARALVKNAPLLILDEATSALDSQSEHVVQQALDNLMRNRTSIVIAHRLSTIIGADRILIVDKGRIAAQGKHEELLVTSPLYAELYRMQFNTDGQKTHETATGN